MDQLTKRAPGQLREFAQFLRAMRERISPSDVGLSVSSRRRAPGLLREEVAQAAGISVTWYTWMEQGRQTNPSLAVLDALASALRLTPVERSHLFRLARPDLERPMGAGGCSDLPEPLSAVLMGLTPRPAYVISALWDVTAWNEAAARLLGGFDTSDSATCNVLYRIFLDPYWRRLLIDWETIARSAVGQFRASSVHLRGDPKAVALVQKLEGSSLEFRVWWRRGRIEEPPTWTKVLDHPRAGRLTFHYATFRLDGAHEHSRLVIYAPADDDTERKFLAHLGHKPAQPD
jgi:transcriptional regulator with XRE-family HTH domain